MTAVKLKVQMQNNYSLGGFVAERIHFSYITHMSCGNQKNCFAKEEDGNISEDFEFKDFNVDDKIGGIDLIKVQVQITVGDEIEED